MGEWEGGQTSVLCSGYIGIFFLTFYKENVFRLLHCVFACYVCTYCTRMYMCKHACKTKACFTTGDQSLSQGPWAPRRFLGGEAEEKGGEWHVRCQLALTYKVAEEIYLLNWNKSFPECRGETEA